MLLWSCLIGLLALNVLLPQAVFLFFFISPAWPSLIPKYPNFVSARSPPFLSCARIQTGRASIDLSPISSLLKKHNIPTFLTSALTGEGISELFNDLAVRAQENEAATSASAAELIANTSTDRKGGSRGENNTGGDNSIIDLDDIDNLGGGEGGVCC